MSHQHDMEFRRAVLAGKQGMAQALAAECSARAAPRDVVEALHDLVQVIAAVINEFTDPVDKGALRDAEQYLLDVAMKHDQLGGYGLYAGFGEEGRT